MKKILRCLLFMMCLIGFLKVNVYAAENTGSQLLKTCEKMAGEAVCG